MRGLCDRFFYYPDRAVYADPGELGLVWEEVDFAGGDGARLNGWFFPSVGAGRGTVVHCHGNAGNISGHFAGVSWLAESGWNLLCFDYRGYGRSGGRVSRRGTIDDAHAAVQYVEGREDGRGRGIVFFGQSVGAAVALVAAAEGAPICGLAVEGAFASYREAARYVLRQQWYTWGAAWPVSRLLISRGWDPIEHIGGVSPRPVLIIQGTDDEILDWRAARRLYEAAREPKELVEVPGAGHMDACDVAADVVRAKLLAFFDRCVGDAAAHEGRT